MSDVACSVEVGQEDCATLEGWVRASKTQQRMVIRARVVLMAAEGLSNAEIGRRLGVRRATASKWRSRYAEQGTAGLRDAPRPGARRRYGPEIERRILTMLDQPPPPGYVTWSGPLLAQALGEVPEHQVWGVLRRRGISLQRRRGWCVSTDPQFGAKAADIVGLYLEPPKNAVVLSVDEKPSIQALERAQGYLKLPNGRAITGQSHEYTRHGTTTLFGALEIATGLVRAGHYHRRRRREFLDFMNGLIAEYPDHDIHVILDNLSTHKPKEDRWLARHPNVQFHHTPTHASWINQIECWFSILTRHALRGASFTSPRQLREAIDQFIEAYNKTAAPFQWTKRIVRPIALAKAYADLYK